MAPDAQSSKRSVGDPAITRRAAEWVQRRAAGLTDSQSIELQQWLAADPRHAAAMRDLEVGSSELDWPLYAGAVDRVLKGLDRRRCQRARRRKRIAVGAMVVMVLVSLGAYRLTSSRAQPAASLVVFAPEVRTLPDGSIAQLKSDADLRVAFTDQERRVELVRGTAHFEVTKDSARPFLVKAGTITARAVGTAFQVSLEPQQVALLVAEGTVALDHDRAKPRAGRPLAAPRETLALVAAGQSVAVSRIVDSTLTPADVTPLSAAESSDRIAWRTPRLEFNGTPLREVIAIVNRYNTEQLTIADAALENAKVSGAVRADRIPALLELLEADFHVVVEHSGNTIILRSSAPRAR